MQSSSVITRTPSIVTENNFPMIAIAGSHARALTRVSKFGRGDVGTTTLEPVSWGEIYQTPQASAATTLRIASGGNANDTAAGTGAREVTLEGIDANGDVLIEAVATAGASASSATSGSFMRLYRAYVSKSGSYATQSAGSHAGSITIENGAGGTTWAIIDATGFPRGQTEIGCYTVPNGYEAYLGNISLTVETNRTVSVVGFHRANILESAAPYTAMRAFVTYDGIDNDFVITPTTAFGPFEELSDIGFMAKGDVAATVSVQFDIILERIA